MATPYKTFRATVLFDERDPRNNPNAGVQATLTAGKTYRVGMDRERYGDVMNPFEGLFVGLNMEPRDWSVWMTFITATGMPFKVNSAEVVELTELEV